jgi:hypothetical protein
MEATASEVSKPKTEMNQICALFADGFRFQINCDGIECCVWRFLSGGGISIFGSHGYNGGQERGLKSQRQGGIRENHEIVIDSDRIR